MSKVDGSAAAGGRCYVMPPATRFRASSLDRGSSRDNGESCALTQSAMNTSLLSTSTFIRLRLRLRLRDVQYSLDPQSTWRPSERRSSARTRLAVGLQLFLHHPLTSALPIHLHLHLCLHLHVQLCTDSAAGSTSHAAQGRRMPSPCRLVRALSCKEDQGRSSDLSQSLPSSSVDASSV